MKAISIQEPKSIAMINVPDLESSLGEEEVLLRILYVGYCGTDLNSFRGLNPLVSYPRIPGHEVSGEIIETGKRVPGLFAQGALVSVFPYTNCGECSSCLKNRPNACKNNKTYGVQRDGCLTEYIKIPYSKLILSPLQDPKKLAMVEPFAVGFHAVRRANIQKDDFVVVIGAGVIGIGAALGASVHSQNVIVIDISNVKLDLMKSLGMKYTINSAHEDIQKRITEITQGRGADVVIEAVGLSQTFVQAIDIVGYSGSVVYIGYPKHEVTYDAKFFLLKELSILGSRGAERIDFENVIHYFLKNNSLDFEKFFTEYELSQAADAMNYWDTHAAEIIKILIKVA